MGATSRSWRSAVILDTSFLIALDAENPDAIETARKLETEAHPRRVPSVVVAELWTAVGKGSRTAENRQKFKRLLEGLPEVELSTDIAKRAGEIEGQAQAASENGSGIGIIDATTAATALEYDEPVLTRDEKDFVRRLQQNLGLGALRVELYTS